MVKRQTPRSSGRRRQPPVAAIAMPEAATPMEEAGQPATEPEADEAVDAVEAAPVEDAFVEPIVEAAAALSATDEQLAEDDLPDSPPVPTLPAAIDSPLPPADAPLVVTQPSRKRPSLVPADLAAAGATLQVFLLNEGIAAFAHWRALTSVRSPADAIRLHLDEMQRAADASLICMGRIAGHFGRAAAA